MNNATKKGHRINELVRTILVGTLLVAGAAAVRAAGAPDPITGSTIRSISAHGKVMTLSSKGTSAKGTPFDFVAVYGKQWVTGIWT
jgi:hypothetical protein